MKIAVVLWDKKMKTCKMRFISSQMIYHNANIEKFRLQNDNSFICAVYANTSTAP
jgi:hypothetical protein